MTQNLSILHTESFLKVAQDEVSHPAASKTKQYVYNPISQIKQSVVIASSFYYKNRVRLSFTVTENFTASSALLRGLIEFHRPKELAFTYRLGNKIIELDVEQTKFPSVVNLINSATEKLIDEIKFKRDLKRVMHLESVFKVELAKAYESLNVRR